VEVEVPATEQRVSSAAAVLSTRAAEVTDDIVDFITREILPLRDDQLVLGLLAASVGENVTTLLHVLEHGIDPRRVDAPTAAIEYARRLAQRGIPMVALVRAYRIGQARFLQWCFDELARGDGGDRVLADATQRLTELSFTYIDRISERVIVIYEQERDRWLNNRATVRVTRVRSELAGDDVDVDATETTLGYRLRRRHLGLVAWVHDGAGGDEDLLRVARAAVCGRRARRRPVQAAVRPVRRIDGVGMASAGARAERRGTGAEHGRGRRRARRLRRARRGSGGLLSHAPPGSTAFADIGPIALMSSDLDQLRAWVLETLGALATDDEQHARLRTTLRVFLETGGSYTATAERLSMHKNTVHYRINKAEEMQGRSFRDRRLGVEVALLAGEQLGSSVLQH
jgi:hypothetical protein